MKTKLGLLLSLLTLSTTAHAGVGLLGGLSFHNISTDNGTSTLQITRDSKAGFVGGLAFSSNFLLLNLEIDALYDYRTLTALGVSASSPAIQVPALFRFSVIPAILDFGIGPYASFNVGSNDLGYNSPDFGAVGSLRVMIPTPGIHLVLDGRYNFGFTNLSQVPGFTAHTREFQIMAGIDVPFFGGEDNKSSGSN
jgi:hypothetical protein